MDGHDQHHAHHTDTRDDHEQDTHYAFSDLKSRFESFAAGGHTHTEQQKSTAPPKPPRSVSNGTQSLSPRQNFADLRSRFESSNYISPPSNPQSISPSPVNPRVPLPADPQHHSSRRSSDVPLSKDIVDALNWAQDNGLNNDNTVNISISHAHSPRHPTPAPPLPPPPIPARPQPKLSPAPPSVSSASHRSASNPASATPSPSPAPALPSNATLSTPPLPSLLRSASSASTTNKRPTPISRPPMPPSRSAASSSPSEPTILPTPSALSPPAPPLRTARSHSATTLPPLRPSIRRSSSSSSTDEDDESEEGEHRGPPSTSAYLSSSAPVMPSAASTSLPSRNGQRLPPDALPDASRANRRPPSFHPPRTAHSRHFHSFAVSGHTVCTASGDKVRVYRVGSTAHDGGNGDKLCSIAAEHGGKEVKITSLAFKPAHTISDTGRYLWCGTREGSLCEMDIATATISNVRHNVHTAPILRIERQGHSMLTMDESGKICTWVPTQPGQLLSLSQQPIAQRVTLEKSTVVISVGAQLWACAGGSVSPSSISSSSASSSDHASSLSATVRSLGNSGSAPSSSSTSYPGVGSPPSSLLSSSPRSFHSSPGGSSPRIRIFNPFSITMSFNATSRPLTMTMEQSRLVGAVTCGTVVPSQPHLVYLGHESGYVSVWDRTKMNCVLIQRLSCLGFTAIAGVGDHLWTGNRSGRISIYTCVDGPASAAWKVLKSWPAHKGPVTSLYVDAASLTVEDVPLLQVASAGPDYVIYLWDGFLNADWLAERMSARRDEFSTHRTIRTLHVSFNIDASSPMELQTSAELMNWLPNVLSSAGEDPPHIIYFGLQEVVDLEDKRLTAKSMLWNAATGGKKARARAKAKAKMAKEHAQDHAADASAAMGDLPSSTPSAIDSHITHQYRMWYDRLVSAVRLAMPPECPYRVVHSESLVGLFTCALIRSDEYSNARDIAIAKVKTGLGGRWGNKGAIVSRLVVDDTSCCFINAHLAAGQKHVKQRNEDVAVIMEAESLGSGGDGSRLDEPGDATVQSLAYVGGGAGELILDHEVVFLSGDLNYRIDLARSQVLQAIRQGSSDQRRRLYEKDQLYLQLTQGGPTFRLGGFQEAQWFQESASDDATSCGTPPPFWPTYKFDPNSNDYDTSEKNRIPAWCDRILHRSSSASQVCTRSYTSWPNVTISDHRPISAVFDVKVKKIDAVKRSVVEEEERGALRGRVEAMVDRAREYYKVTA